MAVIMGPHSLRTFRRPRAFSLSRVIEESISYFLRQNLAILEGKVKGFPLNLQVLGIGDGLTVRYRVILSPLSAHSVTSTEPFDPISWIYIVRGQ